MKEENGSGYQIVFLPCLISPSSSAGASRITDYTPYIHIFYSLSHLDPDPDPEKKKRARLRYPKKRGKVKKDTKSPPFSFVIFPFLSFFFSAYSTTKTGYGRLFFLSGREKKNKEVSIYILSIDSKDAPIHSISLSLLRSTGHT